MTKNITQFRTVAIPATSHFLLFVIIIRGRQKVAKDHGRYIHVFLLVYHYRNTLSIIPHRDGIVCAAR